MIRPLSYAPHYSNGLDPTWRSSNPFVVFFYVPFHFLLSVVSPLLKAKPYCGLSNYINLPSQQTDQRILLWYCLDGVENVNKKFLMWFNKWKHYLYLWKQMLVYLFGLTIFKTNWTVMHAVSLGGGRNAMRARRYPLMT